VVHTLLVHLFPVCGLVTVLCLERPIILHCSINSRLHTLMISLHHKCVYICVAFTQLLTDLDEYTGDLSNVTLPYFDFQTYILKTVLSGLEDSVLSSKVEASAAILCVGICCIGLYVTVLTWLTIQYQNGILFIPPRMEK